MRLKLLVLKGEGVHERVIDARRHVSGNCGVWCSRVWGLHRFFTASARAIVNVYGLGGIVFDPYVWSGEGFVRVIGTMRCCLDLVVFPVGVGVFFRWRYKNRSHVLLYVRSKTMKRHVSRTHRVDLAWLLDQSTWDPGLHSGGNTNQQIADMFDQRFFLSSSVVTTHTTF